MPGEANAMQASINKLAEKLRNEKDPVEIEKLKKAIKDLEEEMKSLFGNR